MRKLDVNAESLLVAFRVPATVLGEADAIADCVGINRSAALRALIDAGFQHIQTTGVLTLDGEMVKLTNRILNQDELAPDSEMVKLTNRILNQDEPA